MTSFNISICIRSSARLIFLRLDLPNVDRQGADNNCSRQTDKQADKQTDNAQIYIWIIMNFK